jgi:diguanylate cyclase (GGDEF)-like protein
MKHLRENTPEGEAGFAFYVYDEGARIVGCQSCGYPAPLRDTTCGGARGLPYPRALQCEVCAGILSQRMFRMPADDPLTASGALQSSRPGELGDAAAASAFAANAVLDQMGAFASARRLPYERPRESVIWPIIRPLSAGRFTTLAGGPEWLPWAEPAPGIDPLTGLLTGAAIRERLSQAWAAALYDGRGPVSVILLDVDRFKDWNDGHGLSAGDDLLARVAAELTANLPAAGDLGRVGGDGFLVVLPDTDGDEALTQAERLRACVDAATWSGWPKGSVTVSGGVASRYAENEDVASGVAVLLRDAELALSRAKRRKNVVRHAREDFPPAKE